jgi:hypothetical protein
MTFLKQIAGAAALGTALLLGLSWVPALAGYVVTLEDVGSDVVATGSGQIGLTGLSFLASGFQDSFIQPQMPARIFTGPNAPTGNFAAITYYSGITGPTSFGSSSRLTFVDSGSGDIVGIQDFFGLLLLGVPTGYISDDPLANTATWLDKNFETLGVTPGTYVWIWGTGADQNFTLVIPTVPEPASAALLGTALAGLLLAGAIRRARHALVPFASECRASIVLYGACGIPVISKSPIAFSAKAGTHRSASRAWRNSFWLSPGMHCSRIKEGQPRSDLQRFGRSSG